MPQKTLRVVAPNEAPSAPKRTFTVTSGACEGTRRDLLVAMRSRVATAVEDLSTPARDLAALTRRLMEIARDIEVMDAKAEEADGGSSTPDEHWVAV